MAKGRTVRSKHSLAQPRLEELTKVGKGKGAVTQLRRYLDPESQMPAQITTSAAYLLIQLSGVGCVTLIQCLSSRLKNGSYELDPASTILALALQQRGRNERLHVRKRVIEALCEFGTFEFARELDAEAFDDFLATWEPGELPEWKINRLAALACNSGYELISRLGSKHESMSGLCFSALPANHSKRLKIARSALDTLVPGEQHWTRIQRVSPFLAALAPHAEPMDKRRLVRALRALGSQNASAPLGTLVARDPELAVEVAKEALGPFNAEVDEGWPKQSLCWCMPLWSLVLTHGGAAGRAWVEGEFSNPPESRPPLDCLRLYADAFGDDGAAFVIRTAKANWNPKHDGVLADALARTRSTKAIPLLVEQLTASRSEDGMRWIARALATLDLGTSEQSLLAVIKRFSAPWAIACALDKLVSQAVELPATDAVRANVLAYVDTLREHANASVRRRANIGWEKLKGLR